MEKRKIRKKKRLRCCQGLNYTPCCSNRRLKGQKEEPDIVRNFSCFSQTPVHAVTEISDRSHIGVCGMAETESNYISYPGSS